MAFFMSLFDGFCLKLTNFLKSLMVIAGKGILELALLGIKEIVWLSYYS